MSYAESYVAAQRFIGDDDERIAGFGRSILLEHGQATQRSAVLFHGLSSTPTQFIEFARALHGRGYNVFVPRLPRHGHRDRLTEELAHLSAAEMKDVATRGVDIARGLGKHVTVLGFSLGGLLAAWTAQHHRVDQAIAIAPFIGVAGVPRRVSGALAALALRLPNRFAWWDPIAREKQQPEHGYPRYCTHALAQAYSMAAELLRDAKDDAPRAARIVIVMNARETSVNNRAARTLVHRWMQRRVSGIQSVVLRGLPFSHDIIEPMRNPQIIARVYPRLLDLVDQDA